jgi:uncharacterized sulfatase
MFTKKSSIQFSHRYRLRGLWQRFFNLSLVYLLLLLAIRTFEIIYGGRLNGYPSNLGGVVWASVYRDFIFFLMSSIWLFVPFAVLYYFSRRLAFIVYVVFATILLLIQFGLVFYFLTALVPLGADVYGYSMAEIKQTVGAAGSLNWISILAFLLLIAIIVAAFRFLLKKMYLPIYIVLIIPVLMLIYLFIPNKTLVPSVNFKSDYVNTSVINKSFFFYNSSRQYFFPPEDDHDVDIYADNFIGMTNTNTDVKGIQSFQYLDPTNYPFLHVDNSEDVLSPFFNIDSAATKPNIVFILVEGLGRAFTNDGAYLGNFTPFIDSLSKKSLYWENFMSMGGRTFAVLPSVLGSLPYGAHGFSELGDKMPPQLSLMSLLKYNGYASGYNYGGDSHFDFMDVFMQHQGVDAINDIKSFGPGYVKMPASSSGFSWGYGDKELFRHYFEKLNSRQKSPFIDVLLTVSTHSPFLINEQDYYLQKFEKRMVELNLSPTDKADRENYKMQFASILYMDDAVKGFFDEFSKRPEFKNTIFLITGDHRMPEIPMSTKIDRYHVPLIIYSPLLKRTEKFQSISTHFDITPSLLAFLRKHYRINTPTVASWMGTGLDTAQTFRNLHGYPYIQTKNGVSDFVLGDWMLNGQQNLFKISSTMDLEPVADPAKLDEILNALKEFNIRNDRFIQGAALIPDSVYQKYKVR